MHGTGLGRKTFDENWPGLATHITQPYRGVHRSSRHHNVGLATEMVRPWAWVWKARRGNLMQVLRLKWYKVCVAAGRSWKDMYVMDLHTSEVP